jgi:hypothetical protein
VNRRRKHTRRRTQQATKRYYAPNLAALRSRRKAWKYGRVKAAVAGTTEFSEGDLTLARHAVRDVPRQDLLDRPPREWFEDV